MKLKKILIKELFSIQCIAWFSIYVSCIAMAASAIVTKTVLHGDGPEARDCQELPSIRLIQSRQWRSTSRVTRETLTEKDVIYQIISKRYNVKNGAEKTTTTKKYIYITIFFILLICRILYIYDITHITYL